MRTLVGFAVGMLALVAQATTQSQSPVKLVAPDAVTNAQLGNQIRTQGAAAIIGAWVDSSVAPYSGSAYVLDQTVDGWVVGQKLVASDGGQYHHFGLAVALAGDVILVGATDANGIGVRTGAAYLFTRSANGWSQSDKLVASDGIYTAGFGRGVALQGDLAIVGAQAQHTTTPWTGAAYVYERISGTWTEIQKLAPSDGESNDWFGGSVALDGRIGCIGAQGASSARGAAYVFEHGANGWTEVQKLAPVDLQRDDYFGWRVALDANTLLIGARGDDDKASNAGAAYVFERQADTWVQTDKLYAEDPTASAAFGIDVAIDDDRALVGAASAHGHKRFTGAAHLFKRTAGRWVEERKLIAPDGMSDDRFGFAVALSRRTAFAGALVDSTHFLATGSVYAFDLGASTRARRDGTALAAPTRSPP